MAWLLIKNDGLGDLVLASGLIKGLGEFLKTDLELITCIQNRPIAERLEGLSRVHYVSRDGITFTYGRGEFSFESDALDRRVLSYLQEEEFEGAICLRRFIRKNSLLLMRMVKAKRKYCCWQFVTNASIEEARFASEGWIHIDPDHSLLHELRYYQKFLQEILDYDLRHGPQIKGIRNGHTKEMDRVGFIVSGDASKLPPETWASLAELCRKDGFNVMLLGGLIDEEHARQIEGRVPYVTNLVGKYSDIIGISREMQKCFGLIGNDTGLTHFASVFHPYIVVPMGGGTFGRFFPWPDCFNQLVPYHSLECYDCDWRCRWKICLHLLDPKKIYQLFRSFVTEKKVGPGMIDINPHPTKYEVGWRRRVLF